MKCIVCVLVALLGAGWTVYRVQARAETALADREDSI